MSARYNGYFNAKELVLASKISTEDAHLDDFTQVLDVYRWGNEVTGKSQASSMDKAIEKCSEVIQNKEGSEWIDDAYFTVAQAYFYKGDYYEALDLFKYLASEYKDKEMEPKARIWIVQTYIQMGKLNDAQAFMSTIQNERKKFSDYETQIQLVDAHLKIKVNNTSEAILNLDKAIPNVKNRKEKHRYKFILAQLYEGVGNKRKANELYASLLSKNMPYEFQFQTRLKVAKSTNLSNKASAEKVVKSFKKLLRDDNNREYFDQIHYEIANVYLESGNKEKAIEHYKLSAWLGDDNFSQKANTYLALGDLYFNDQSFENAGLYYDSCATVVPENHPKYNQIIKQQGILSTLINNLQAIKTQDSLQHLATLDPDDIEKLIDKKLENEELAAQKAAQKEELKKKRDELKKEMNTSSIANAPNMMNNSGEWYFYNPAAIGKGATDFRLNWGNRPLEDNWRRSQKAYVFSGNDEKDTTLNTDSDSLNQVEEPEPLPHELTEKLANIDESKKEYFTNIPFLAPQRRASDNIIIEALYDNGVIYYEQLEDLASAVKSFNELMTRFPGNKYEAAVHYYIYKIYLDQGEEAKAEEQKQILKTDFPNSQYTKLIDNNGKFDKEEANPILERYYNLAYNYYSLNQCDSVISTYKTANKMVETNYLRANFEFLTTLCKGKSLPIDSFIAELQGYLNVYKGNDVAKEAKNLIRYLEANKPKTEAEKAISDSTALAEEEGKTAKDFIFSTSEEGSFYFILSSKQKDASAQKIKSEFANYNVLYHRSEALSVKSLEFDDSEMLFWVKTFNSIEKAKKYFDGIVNDEDFAKRVQIDSPSMFYISTDNFKLLISEQNTQEYIEFFDWYFVNKED